MLKTLLELFHICLTANNVSHINFLFVFRIDLLTKFNFSAKMRKRGSIVSKLLAKMIVQAGFTHVITMDLHQKEIQGFFDCPVDNLRASPFLLQYIQDSVIIFFLKVGILW